VKFLEGLGLGEGKEGKAGLIFLSQFDSCQAKPEALGLGESS